MESSVSPAPVRKNNPLALTAGLLGLGSILLALIGFLITFIPGVGLVVSGICCGIGALANLVALVLGIVGLVQLKSRPEQTGKVWAIVGIVFGALTLLSICLLPILGTAILTILGPVIGNVFTQINSNLVVP